MSSNQKRRPVWFLLMDSVTGESYQGTTASSVVLPPGFVVDQFRDAVKAKNTAILTTITASQLLVYKNKDAFDKRNAEEGREEPLEVDMLVDDLGKSKKDALVVAVPSAVIPDRMNTRDDKVPTWFLLVDSVTAESYQGTTASSVVLPPGFVVDQFRDAVKAKNTNKLSSIDASDLLVYKNKDAFEKRNAEEGREEPLEVDMLVDDLGKSKKEALVVAVPSSSVHSGILPESLTIPSSVRTAYVKALGDEYKDNSGLVERFKKTFTEDFGQNWNATGFYSPYCALVQSSGTGKTRFILELGRKIHVIYICLREEGDGSNGFPLRSTLADKVLMQNATEYYFLQFLLSCLCVVNDSYSDVNLLRDATARVDVESKAEIEFAAAVGSKFNEIQVKCQNLSTMDEGQVKEYVRGILAELKNLHGKPVSFAFDESAFLLNCKNKEGNSFNLIRRALKHFMNKADQSPIVTGIFTDTNSKVSNFVEADHAVSSTRYIEGKLKLFAPIWVLPSWSLHFEKPVAELVKELPVLKPLTADSQTLNEQDALDFALTVFRIGRPMFPTLIKNYTNQDSAGVEQLLKIGALKIACLNPGDDTKVPQRDALLGILDNCLSLSVRGNTKSAFDLVASHMAVCYYISEKRDFVYSGYPCEPLLNAGARYWLSSLSLLDLLRYLAQFVNEGLLDKGNRGELLGRFITMLGFSRTIRRLNKESVRSFNCKFYVQPVKLKDYLACTYSNEFIAALDASTRCDDKEKAAKRKDNLNNILNGSIRLHKCTKISGTPDTIQNELIYNLGLVCITCDNQAGWDSFFAVQLKDGSYSRVYIQDKNRIADSTISEASKKLAETRVMKQSPSVPYLVIHRSFGLKNGATESIYQEHEKIDEKENPEDVCQFMVSVKSLSAESYTFISDEGSQEDVEEIVDLMKKLREGRVYIDDPLASEYVDGLRMFNDEDLVDIRFPNETKKRKIVEDSESSPKKQRVSKSVEIPKKASKRARSRRSDRRINRMSKFS